MKLIRLLLLTGCYLVLFPIHAAEVKVAVAANFINPARAIASEFEKISGHRVKLSFGSSGKLYAQIRHGAPFDLFFSADQEKPQALEKAQLTVANSRITYAVGRLALWCRLKSQETELEDRLRRLDFQHLALANVKLAPYGKAAAQVLEHLGLVETSRSRWVVGENIGQTFQFVRSGNAELGFIALSQVVGLSAAESGSYWLVPDSLHQPIRQDLVWLQAGKENPAAKALMAFINSKQARRIIESYGYLVPAVVKAERLAEKPLVE